MNWTLSSLMNRGKRGYYQEVWGVAGLKVAGERGE